MNSQSTRKLGVKFAVTVTRSVIVHAESCTLKMSLKSLNITPEKSAKRLSYRLSTPMSGLSQMVTTPPSGSNTGATSSQASTSKLS